MNCSVIKNINLYNTAVFSTKKTLHERFTPETKDRVFILNSDDSAVLEDNKDTSVGDSCHTRIVLSPNVMETNEICNNLIKDTDIEYEEKPHIPLILLNRKVKNECNPNNLRNKCRKQSYSNLISLTGPKNNYNNQFRLNKRVSSVKSWSKPFHLRFKWRRYRKHYTYKSFRCYNGTHKKVNIPNFDIFGKYRYIRRYPYQWRRKRNLVTKEQLDDEIDKYMAGVLFSTGCTNLDKDDPTEIFLDETEQFLKSL